MKHSKKLNFRNSTTDFQDESEVLEIRNWLSHNSCFAESSEEEVFSGFNEMRKECCFPELHRPVSTSCFEDWVSISRVWELISLIKKTGRDLNIGCGEGWPAIPLALRGRTVVGIDSSGEKVKTAQENAEILEAKNAFFLKMSPENLDFNCQTFGTVLLQNRLEGCSDLKKLFFEAERVLKPKGRLVVGGFDSWKNGRVFFHPFEFHGLSLPDQYWRFIFSFKFKDSGLEENLMISFNDSNSPSNEKVLKLFLGHGVLRKKDFSMLQKVLLNVKNKARSIFSNRWKFSFNVLAPVLENAGFRGSRVVRDAGKMVKPFLGEQNLSMEKHPFRALPVFEGICSSLGSLAGQTEIDFSCEDGLIIVDKRG